MGLFQQVDKPLLKVESGDYATIETVTHHLNDDIGHMAKSNAGVESIFHWDAKGKNIDRRGMGLMDHPLGAGSDMARTFAPIRTETRA